MTSSLKRDGSHDNGAALFSLRPAGLTSAAMLLACCLLGYTTPSAATSTDEMLSKTPLVLKDGRIAEVSVHTIPFPADAAAPASSVKSQLDIFTRSIATDCFLTAQVIGHVDTNEISGRQTADIHRLARARADEIQKSLIGNGLPATSIASVWDWRFMVKQPRVTLWVFRLTAGDDCDDAPLHQSGGDQVAAIATPETTAVDTSAEQQISTPASVNTATPPVVKQQVIPAAKPKDPGVTAAIPAVPAARDVKEDRKAVTTEVVSPPKIQPTSKAQVASLSPDEAVDKRGAISLVNDGALEIIFATNSSYFPEGAGDQLRAFMKTLEKGKSYVLRIQTSIDGNASVAGVSSSDEAQRYNAWLAERRFKRVEAWLLKNSDGRTLTIESSLIENDGSRRVRIEPNPLG